MNTVKSNSYLSLQAAALSDQGQLRALNEDATFEQTIQTGQGDVGLYLVCDGLGGHRAGDVASRLAVETVPAELAAVIPEFGQPAANGQPARLTDAQLNQAIRTAITRANEQIDHYAAGQGSKSSKPGTTLTMALVYNHHAYIANVGDSRTYIWRRRHLTQITKDHSLVAKLEEFGVINKAEAMHHPNRNIISQALGATKNLEIDLFKWKLQPGDKLLLCSDGFWQSFSASSELTQWLNAELPPAVLSRQLVEEANRRDGSDNISVVIVYVG
jgi:protein phosphatase